MAAKRLQHDSAAERRAEESALELIDVPAAVVCAHCGAPDCPGCLGVDEPTYGSGVVAIIPWERPDSMPTRRFWQTAKLATLESQPFFTALPEGNIAPALTFAIIAELLAVSSIAVVIGAALFAVIPDLPAHFVGDLALRRWVLGSLAWAVPGLALSMVGLHALHGHALDLAAKRRGSSRRKPRGIRFGLYSCAWDFVTLPVGWLALLLDSGLGAAVKAIPLALNVPGRASRAYLRGFHRLDGDAARVASREAVMFSGAIAVGVTLLGAAAYVVLAVIG
jgi:hypothetical protein